MLVAVAVAGFWPSAGWLPCLVVCLAAGLLLLPGAGSTLPSLGRLVIPLTSLAGGASVVAGSVDSRVFAGVVNEPPTTRYDRSASGRLNTCYRKACPRSPAGVYELRPRNSFLFSWLQLKPVRSRWLAPCFDRCSRRRQLQGAMAFAAKTTTHSCKALQMTSVRRLLLVPIRHVVFGAILVGITSTPAFAQGGAGACCRVRVRRRRRHRRQRLLRHR